MTDELSKFREGMSHCPACGAQLTYTDSADGCGVDITHPYDPADGPPCAPFLEFCRRLLERGGARDFVVAGRRPHDEREQCPPGEHVAYWNHPDRCGKCGIELGPTWGYPSITRTPPARGQQ